MLQNSYVTPVGKSAPDLVERVVDVEVREGALFLRGEAFTTVYAAGAWASVTTVPSGRP